MDPEKGKAAYEADVQAILAGVRRRPRRPGALHAGPLGRVRGRPGRSRVINIHHGFLPAFQGAKPYHQAWAKGVKIIGATAHFVSDVLDQGPIIAQDVLRVADTRSVSEFIRMGKDVERKVLYEALRLYLDNSVFVREGRTFIIQ